MGFAQPHFIAHLTLTTFSHETVAIYNSYQTQNFFFYSPITYGIFKKILTEIIEMPCPKLVVRE
jgi:hypothetical protein